MGKEPIDIEWKVIFGSLSPPREVDVVSSSSAASSGGGDGGAAEFAGFSDDQLRERAKRMRAEARSLAGRLKDGGEKLRNTLGKLEHEMRRRAASKSRKASNNAEACKQAALSTTDDPFAFELCDEADLNQKASKFHLQSSSIPSKKKNYCQDEVAFAKELSLLGQGKCASLKKDGQQRPILVDKMYSSKPYSRNSVGHQQRIRANDPKGTDDKKRQRDTLNNFITRRKRSKHQDSSQFEFEKVQDVVLLDDEDAEPVESINNDVPDKLNESKMYYPSRNDPEAVELTYSDIKCLEPEVYLSSPVINFYIQYLKRSRSPEGGPKGDFYIFNTYFYSKLEEALSGTGDCSSRFFKLRRWWKGVNIFQKAYIILPIHGKMHWSLIIICIPPKESKSGPIILHLDSLGLHSSGDLFDTIERYLEEEWSHLRQSAPMDLPISERIWEHLRRTIHKEKIAVPQQRNEYDCGIFMLYYIERFMREAPERLRTEDLDMFGRKWFKPEEASGLRQRIRALLLEEFESVRLEDGLSGAEPPDTSEGDEDQDDVIIT